MKNKKQPDVINTIRISMEEFRELNRKVHTAYENSGYEDLSPDMNYEKDEITLTTINGELSVEVYIKLSCRETIKII